ncbi:hypothetical protein OUZ56_029459 [Daphnia magna]|uniref:Integrase core domain-containing protein n=1 Tax=Daphnia magna TaxID=35525 RepID=A0ABR0B6X8_9CRUS|nr:hypothetical protein OUZ56_029459 [Daphnia magna]
MLQLFVVIGVKAVERSAPATNGRPKIHVDIDLLRDYIVGLFERAVSELAFQWLAFQPANVEYDLGGENILLADFMINARGVNRKCFRTGTSVHNQRIEHLWKDVIERCTTTFMDMFEKMETDDILEFDCEIDLFCLHLVGYDLIQRSLQTFREAWSCHPIRTKKHNSLMELYIKGLQTLKEEHEAGAFVEEPTELLQGKKTQVAYRMVLLRVRVP